MLGLDHPSSFTYFGEYPVCDRQGINHPWTCIVDIQDNILGCS